MSKIDIDKLFRDKFHGHENSSNVYTPDRWKDFEKQLDKNLPADKKGGFRFNLNNLLIFISCLVIVVMVPLLLLQSKGVDNSSTISERALLTHKSTVSDKVVVNKNSDEKQIDHSTVSVPAKTLASTEVAAIAKETNTQAETNPSKPISAIRKPDNEEIKINRPEMKEAVKINSVLLTNAMVEKDTSTVSPKNVAVTVDTNTKTKNGKTKKPGKIKRSGVLVPHVDYNGL
jgi:hypothetical protein